MKSILENIAVARAAAAALRDEVVAVVAEADEANRIVLSQTRERVRDVEKLILTAQDMLDELRIIR